VPKRAQCAARAVQAQEQWAPSNQGSGRQLAVVGRYVVSPVAPLPEVESHQQHAGTEQQQ